MTLPSHLSMRHAAEALRAAADSDRSSDTAHIDVLHDIGSRIAASDPLQRVLARVVDFVSSLVKCDSCFIYVLEGDALILRASKNPHPESVDQLTLRLG